MYSSRSPVFRFLTAALAAFTLIALSLQAARAQSDWLDRAKGLLGGSGGSADSVTSAALSTADIVSGLREALIVGTQRVVDTLGKTDGFNANPELHIPLPDSLRTVQSTLQKVGMSGMADDLELRLNRAAETATPKAKQIFWDAIKQMTIDDARGIYNGPDDAATRYFQGKTTQPLNEAMTPVIDSALAEAGAIQAYDKMMGQYRSLPFVPDAKAELTTYVLDRALDGMFLYLSREEAAIRQNPAKRSTELLQKVFGAR